MSEPEKMILAAEAAKRLHVTTRTVQRWVKKGYFPGARKKSPTLSGAYLIPESALLAYEQELLEKPGGAHAADE